MVTHGVQLQRETDPRLQVSDCLQQPQTYTGAHPAAAAQVQAMPFPPAGTGMPQGSCNPKTVQDITILVQKLSGGDLHLTALAHPGSMQRVTPYTFAPFNTQAPTRNKMELNSSEGKQPFSTQDFHFNSLMAPCSQSRSKECGFVLMPREQTCSPCCSLQTTLSLTRQTQGFSHPSPVSRLVDYCSQSRQIDAQSLPHFS